MDEPQPQPQPRPLALIDTLYTVLLTAVMAWTVYQLMIRPAWPRARARLLRSFHRGTCALARLTAAYSMRRELYWGIADYRLPYQLSLLRDRYAAAADDAEEALRP